MQKKDEYELVSQFFGFVCFVTNVQGFSTLTKLLFFQLVTFFRGFGMAAPAKSFMYSLQSNILYKVVYAQYLKMQVTWQREKNYIMISFSYQLVGF